MRLPSGEQHFIGFKPASNKTRVSSAVASFDIDSLMGITSSGREYWLQGEPDDGDDECVVAVWRAWCLINRVESFEDVSQETWRRHCARKQRCAP